MTNPTDKEADQAKPAMKDSNTVQAKSDEKGSAPTKSATSHKRPDRGEGKRKGGKWFDKPKKEFEETMLEIRRVTRVTTGGRQLSFRATILVWNKKGKIGLGVAKGPDVQIAIQKASHDAYKNITQVPITEEGSIPYAITKKYKASYIKLLPAASGTGLKAWSSLRLVLELAGYSNVLSKIVGTNNKLNNALNAIQALSSFKLKSSTEVDSDKKGDEKKKDEKKPVTKPSKKKAE